MSWKSIRSVTFLGITFFLLLSFPVNGKTQGLQQVVPSKRARECFDFNWLFHKGDIAIKQAIKAGKYGGLTDINVKVVTGEEAAIAYTDANKAAAFKPGDWQEVNLPHDWFTCSQWIFARRYWILQERI